MRTAWLVVIVAVAAACLGSCTAIVDIGDLVERDGDVADVLDGDIDRPESADADADVDVDGEADSDVDVDGGLDAVDAVDADADVESAEDLVRDVDTDTGSEGDGRDDGGPEVDAEACTEAWYDPATGYLWSVPSSSGGMDWVAAISYCDALSACEYAAGTWRTPTIGELRTLIRGCSSTVIGGACGVGDSCLASSCYSSTSCYPPTCLDDAGPGESGCYWDSGLGGLCSWVASSSSQTDDTSKAWNVFFGSGYIFANPKTTPTLEAVCLHRES